VVRYSEYMTMKHETLRKLRYKTSPSSFSTFLSFLTFTYCCFGREERTGTKLIYRHAEQICQHIVFLILYMVPKHRWGLPKPQHRILSDSFKMTKIRFVMTTHDAANNSRSQKGTMFKVGCPKPSHQPASLDNSIRSL
jgi:hypothetical protein